jgi:hypothetical protein
LIVLDNDGVIDGYDVYLNGKLHAKLDRTAWDWIKVTRRLTFLPRWQALA